MHRPSLILHRYCRYSLILYNRQVDFSSLIMGGSHLQTLVKVFHLPTVMSILYNAMSGILMRWFILGLLLYPRPEFIYRARHRCKKHYQKQTEHGSLPKPVFCAPTFISRPPSVWAAYPLILESLCDDFSGDRRLSAMPAGKGIGRSMIL